MKKLIKPFVIFAAILAGAAIYKYVLFDHEPFDNIKASDIENIYLTRMNDDWRVEVNDIPQFLDNLEEVELRCRTTEIRQENVVSGVKVSIYYTDGSTQFIVVDNIHVLDDDKLFEAEREEAYYFLEYANELIFEDRQLKDYYDKTRHNTVIGLYLQGMTQRQVREWVKSELIGKVMDEVTLKSLARSSWAPEQIYAITDEKRQELIQDMKDAVMPGGAVKRLTYETMADEVLEQYRNGEITYDDVYSAPPREFVFPENIDWSRYSFSQNEMGYFALTIPSVNDRDLLMNIFVDDMIYDGVIREHPLIKYVGFYHR